MPSLSKEAALVHEALVARGLETPLRPPVHEMDNETRKSKRQLCHESQQEGGDG